MGLVGNYDVTKLHYEGAGDAAGSDGKPYGYNMRIAGQMAAASA